MEKLLGNRWVNLFLLVVASMFSGMIGAMLVNAFFSHDSWSAYSAVGTWVTGIFAGVIAFTQFIEAKRRKKDLKNRVNSALQRKVYEIAEHLFFSVHVYEMHSFQYPDGIPENRREGVNIDFSALSYNAIDKMEKIILDLAEREYIDEALEKSIDELNQGIDRFKYFILSYSNQNQPERKYVEENIKNLRLHLKNVLENISKISPGIFFVQHISKNLELLDKELVRLKEEGDLL